MSDLLKTGELSNIVVNFQSRKATVQESVPIESESVQETADLTPEQLKKLKIANAKINGTLEIKKFKQIVENFVRDVNDLALFNGVGDDIETALKGMSENVIEPVLKGIQPYGMGESMYKQLRLNFFNSLIKKYDMPKKQEEPEEED